MDFWSDSRNGHLVQIGRHSRSDRIEWLDESE